MFGTCILITHAVAFFQNCNNIYFVYLFNELLLHSFARFTYCFFRLNFDFIILRHIVSMWMTFVHLDESTQTFLTDLPKMNMNFFLINYQMQVMIFTLFIAF